MMKRRRVKWSLFYLLFIGFLMPLRSASSSDHPTLIYKWLLTKVIYKETQQSFIPKTYQGFTLYPDGNIIWSDGCNTMSATYEIHEGTFHIDPPMSTLIGCNIKIEDVHYEDVTHYTLEGKTLTLQTPTQMYILERFPFSRMSMNPWSLHSIIDQKTDEVRDIGRFRTEYSDLFLTIQDDQTFTFRDLDHQSYTGTVTVEEGGHVRIHYDQESRERLQDKEKTYAYLSDNTNHYRKTTKKYATYYADELHWEFVTFFKVENEYLFFYSDNEIYKFEPR